MAYGVMIGLALGLMAGIGAVAMSVYVAAVDETRYQNENCVDQ